MTSGAHCPGIPRALGEEQLCLHDRSFSRFRGAFSGNPAGALHCMHSGLQQIIELPGRRPAQQDPFEVCHPSTRLGTPLPGAEPLWPSIWPPSSAQRRTVSIGEAGPSPGCRGAATVIAEGLHPSILAQGRDHADHVACTLFAQSPARRLGHWITAQSFRVKLLVTAFAA